MAQERVERRLAAILAADVVGYSRLIRADEEGTLASLRALREDVVDPKIAEHRGRIVKLMGDGVLVEFASVVDAVRCAAEIQRTMIEREADTAEDRRIRYRVGVNLGDIVVDGDDILGDGVNVAARLEGLAEPGGICIPRKVLDEVRNRLDLGYTYIGLQQVKNIETPVPAYSVLLDPAAVGTVTGEEVAGRKGIARLAPTVAVAVGLLAIVAGVWFFGLRGPTSTSAPVGAIDDRKLSMVVLPFGNLSGDKAQDHFADAITEDLISDLSRIRGAFVIARGTAFTYKGKAVNATSVARELDVRFVVEGSVRRSDDRVRVNVRLVDGRNGADLWSAKLDRAYKNTFMLQSDITGHIAAVLKVELLEAESRRAGRRAPTNLQAWDYAVQGHAILHRGHRGPLRFAKALKLFEKALELDPKLALAWEGISFIHYVAATRYLPGVSGNHNQLALDTAKKAVDLDDKSSGAHTVLGLAYVWIGKPALGLSACVTALGLNRNNDDAHICAAQAQRALGRYADAIQSLERSRQLNPRFRAWRRDMLVGANWALLGKYDKALAALTKAKVGAPNHQVVNNYLVAVLALSGRLKEARRQLAVYMKLVGDDRNTIEKLGARNRYVSPHYDRILEGLRKAGMPER